MQSSVLRLARRQVTASATLSSIMRKPPVSAAQNKKSGVRELSILPPAKVDDLTGQLHRRRSSIVLDPMPIRTTGISGAAAWVMPMVLHRRHQQISPDPVRVIQEIRLIMVLVTALNLIIVDSGVPAVTEARRREVRTTTIPKTTAPGTAR